MNLWEVNILNRKLARIARNAKRIQDGRTPIDTRKELCSEIWLIAQDLIVEPKFLKYTETEKTRSFL